MTRLICFPCAGGKASFFSSWEKDLPASIEVCAVSWSTIENRSEQALSANYSGLVATLAEAIRPLLDRPFALYGHSLGSLVAYEVARFLRSHYTFEPAGLFFAGSPAPQVWVNLFSSYEDENEEKSIKEKPIQALLSSFQAYSPDLQEDMEQRALMEEVLKRDAAPWSTYVYLAADPFRCPLAVFGGWQDEFCRYPTLPPWKIHTTGAFSLRMFSGGHFFPFTHTPILEEMITKQLQS